MRIVLGVGGGIAAYKACEVASRLTQAGHHVNTIMTEAARQFVAPLTFEALTHQPVSTRVTDSPVGPLSHVTLARDAELLLLAPATADLLTRMAAGRADDMLTAVALGARCPVWAAPAMEPEMWSHAAVQAAATVLTSRGVRFFGPIAGRMASGREGIGRLVDPARLVEAVRRLEVPQDLAGLRVLVTAGPTWEFFDPVRILTNPSTGQMGVAIAEAARDRGAQVTLVHGPLQAALTDGDGMELMAVVTTADMLRAVQTRAFDQDVIVGAAAVSDFRPRTTAASKMKKDEVAAEGAWAVTRTEDILDTISRLRGAAAKPLLVGFKAETDDHVARARAMLHAKHLALVVANRVERQKGFGQVDSEAWFVTADQESTFQGPKKALAQKLWDIVRGLCGR